MDKNEIQSLVAKNNLEEAIAELDLLTQKTKWHREILLQSSRLSEYKRLQRSGTEATSELNRLKNQITHALLSIIDELPDVTQKNSSKKKPKPFSKNTGWIFGIIASVATIIGFSIKGILLKEINPSFINATIFLESKLGSDELRKQGYIFMDVQGGERKKELIDDKGTASFKNVKVGDKVKLNVDFSEPFKPKIPDSIYTIPSDGRIYLEVELQNLDRVFGTVIWRDQPVPGVLVAIENLRDTTDITGKYSIIIPQNAQRKEQEVQFFKQGFKMKIKKAFPQTNVPLNIIMEK